MAEKKMTRVEALNVVLEATRDGFESEEMTEAREVLKKMVVQLSKPRKKSDAPSKTRVENLALVDAACAAMGSAEVSAKWLTEHVRGILTTQKAAAVMRLGVEVGKVEKVVDGRKVSYKCA